MAATRKTPAEKLEELKQQKAQIENRIARERAKVKGEERKRDTRRKIVAGAIVLEHADKDPAFRATLRGLLERHATREQDRVLFDLPPQAPAGDESR